jgi:predicted ATPase
MAQQPFLKSIRPVNLLSFGPDTEEIELRPLNILIGPNGSGKSNLIEIIGLLKELPDKDPWSVVKRSGADEWFWKDGKYKRTDASIDALISLAEEDGSVYKYFLRLTKYQSLLGVSEESLKRLSGSEGRDAHYKSFRRTASHGEIVNPLEPGVVFPKHQLVPERSIFSQLNAFTQQVGSPGSPELYEIGEFFSKMVFYRDWEFGVSSEPRDPQPAGERTDYLEEDHRNLAHMLNALRTGDNFGLRERFKDALSKFYASAEDIETELPGGRVSMRLLETNGISTPAIRLSDGTLRWLALLAILFNPAPPPVTCIEEPELGLHPDIIPTLADLLRDASTRTQLILTTHSESLISAFSDDPESVCVCEKVDGATRIRRLSKDRLAVWLEDYSLGHLWASGEIGGNRW